MSSTYDLICVDKKIKIWVGQSRRGETGMASFYSGEPQTMLALGRFLQATEGHSLKLVCDDLDSDEAAECEYFEGRLCHEL